MSRQYYRWKNDPGGWLAGKHSVGFVLYEDMGEGLEDCVGLRDSIYHGPIVVMSRRRLTSITEGEYFREVLKRVR